MCHTEALDRISSYTASLSLSMQIDVQAPSSVKDNLGSAEVLRVLANKISVSRFLAVLRVERFYCLIV